MGTWPKLDSWRSHVHFYFSLSRSFRLTCLAQKHETQCGFLLLYPFHLKVWRAFWDALQLNVVIKGCFLSYCSLPVTSDKSGYSHLISHQQGVRHTSIRIHQKLHFPEHNTAFKHGCHPHHQHIHAHQSTNHVHLFPSSSSSLLSLCLIFWFLVPWFFHFSVCRCVAACRLPELLPVTGYFFFFICFLDRFLTAFASRVSSWISDSWHHVSLQACCLPHAFLFSCTILCKL